MHTTVCNQRGRGRKTDAGDANKEVVINTNTPHTPRKRGAEIASNANYTLALDLWREVCAAAGLSFIVDNCTANGARKIAARYLDTGELTPEAVRKAMAKLAHIITHNERSSHYTLNALGNNISRYLEVPKATTTGTTGPSKPVLWDFMCNVCGETSAAFLPGHVQPNPTPCGCRGCRGMAIPKKG